MTLRKVMFGALVCVGVSLAAETPTHTLTATKYHPGMGGAGWVPASGDRIDKGRLARHEIRWVALSHDMFNKGYRMGDTIEVTCERLPAINGKWVVKDKMGKRLRNRIDFLLPRGDDYGFAGHITVEIRKAR